MKAHRRRTSALRRGRVSIPGARYYLTIVTKDRIGCLQDNASICACAEVSVSLDENDDWTPICLVVMPDHIHLLVILGYKLDLERVVSKWKTQVRRSLGWSSVRWQENFYDHRLRPADSIEAIGRYMYLNPYRSGLIESELFWPGWVCQKPEWFKFLEAVRENPNVVDEWLDSGTDRPWDHGA